jgi:hypothetical protein
MKRTTGITCAFLDIGGVLLTDGWDHLARRRASVVTLKAATCGQFKTGHSEWAKT